MQSILAIGCEEIEEFAARHTIEASAVKAMEPVECGFAIFSRRGDVDRSTW